MMDVNLNQNCTVRLRKRGINAIYAHYASVGMVPPKDYQEGEEYTAQLWEIMQIFGGHITLGMDSPFDTTIRLTAL